jgi:hypothetical protein
MSAVLKENYVETIFDHGVTDDEMINLFGYIEEIDIYSYKLSNDFALGDLYRLYKLRGKEKSANEFLSKLSSESEKENITRSGCCDDLVCSQLLHGNPKNFLHANN